jgi:hypothetical protein
MPFLRSSSENLLNSDDDRENLLNATARELGEAGYPVP